MFMKKLYEQLIAAFIYLEVIRELNSRRLKCSYNGGDNIHREFGRVTWKTENEWVYDIRIDLRDKPRRICCEDGWMDLIEEANFGVSNVNSGYFKRYLRITLLLQS
jgi:hypothetical protein